MVGVAGDWYSTRRRVEQLLNTRAIAAQIAIRVRDEGAYSNVLLPHETADLSGPDRAFVYSLVTSVLRKQRHVDGLIAAASSRPVGELDPEVSAVLQVAAAELLTDTKGVVYATVNESVEAVKELGHPKAASFVNAVLRRLVREIDASRNVSFSVSQSIPDWLADRLEEDHGREEAQGLIVGLRRPAPQVPIRVRPGGLVPEGADPIPGISSAYYLRALPQDFDGVVADAASTAVGNAVDGQPGQKVLDMAAAPGGKTIQLWDQIQPGGRLVAMDRHRRRLRSARSRLRYLDVSPSWVIGDGRHSPFADGSFDAVLVDAPCTGLGTLRRRPEIAMRLEPDSPDLLAVQQRELLAEAWRVTRPGGRVVYSVCTVLATETTEVVAEYPAHPPADLPGRIWGNGLLLAPHTTGTDGMFVAVIER